MAEETVASPAMRLEAAEQIAATTTATVVVWVSLAAAWEAVWVPEEEASVAALELLLAHWVAALNLVALK